MSENLILMNANPVVRALKKMPSEFTKEDIINYIDENGIQMVNFMYPGGDGRLKTLSFTINSKEYLDTVLTCGERVDGSSLFSFIQAGSSDLYVLPRFSTAFRDPFAEIPTLCLLCSFFDKDGEPLASSPEHTLVKATRAFQEVTGMEFHAMGELEYYVVSVAEEKFPAVDQRGYHESAPFFKTGDFRQRCMHAVAQCGGQIKYGHSEVGNFTMEGLCYEQNEIEFLPVPAVEAADQLMIAKWVIRNKAWREGYDVTFSPKIIAGKAGSGLHVHMRIMKDGKNQMIHEGALSEAARRIGTDYAIVNSIDGYDEISLTGDFKVATNSYERVFSPSDLGLRKALPEELVAGATEHEAAEIFDAVLENRALQAQKDIVIANAAFGIQTFERGKKSIEECIAIARESLESGKALATFKKFREINS